MKRELTILEKVRNVSHAVNLLGPMRDSEGTPAFALEFEPHDERRYESMTVSEIKIFTRQLLKALTGVHSLGIMHRDVKPKNLRYDFERMRLVCSFHI